MNKTSKKYKNNNNNKWNKQKNQKFQKLNYQASTDYNKEYSNYKQNRKIVDIKILKETDIDQYKGPANNSKIAIIIPHRNRLDHLKQFIDHFNNLNSYTNEVDVYVIDQNNADQFNRGLLLNIGFEIADNMKKYDRFIFHDVDSYPEQILYDLYFKHFDKTIHFASPYLEYKYNYYTFFGGIVGMSKNDFKKINGFPNSFFGHGGEDDSMFNRIAECNMDNVYRPNEGKYYLVDHASPTALEANKIKKKNILGDLIKWQSDGLQQLKKIFLNIKKYNSYDDFLSKYDVENSNITNNPTPFDNFLNSLLVKSNDQVLTDSDISMSITSTTSVISNFDIKKSQVNYYFYKIDYLAKHKFETDMFVDKNFVATEINTKNQKMLDGELKNKKVFYNKFDKSYVSVIYPIISWDEVQEKIIDTYTSPKLFNLNRNGKYDPKLKSLVKTQFEKYNKNLSKDDLFNTLRHVFDNYNEVLYFRIRNGKIECQYQLYNPKNKKDWYKDLKYTVNGKTTSVDDAFLQIAQSSNKEYFTLRKPHFMASNNCLLGGLDEYAYWEGNPVSYVNSFKEMLEYVVDNFDVPDCDILINRKDFPYLRKDKKYGYDHLTDDLIDEDIIFYPLGSQAVTDDSLDVPIVSADEWEFSKTEKNKTNWESKNPVALFRGSGTGCSVDMSNPRIRLAQLSEDWSHDNTKSNLIDVKLSKLVGRIKSYKKFIGVTDYKKYKHLVGEFMNTEQQMKYKYVFNVEGNSQAYRFSSQFYKGLVINVKSKYYMWFAPLLEPNKNFIEVEPDYSDLYDKITYLKQNDNKAKQIYQNGLEFAEKYTSQKSLAEYMFHYMYYLNKYAT